jgi:hypothetical protein
MRYFIILCIVLLGCADNEPAPSDECDPTHAWKLSENARSKLLEPNVEEISLYMEPIDSLNGSAGGTVVYRLDNGSTLPIQWRIRDIDEWATLETFASADIQGDLPAVACPDPARTVTHKVQIKSPTCDGSKHLINYVFTVTGISNGQTLGGTSSVEITHDFPKGGCVIKI